MIFHLYPNLLIVPWDEIKKLCNGRSHHNLELEDYDRISQALRLHPETLPVLDDPRRYGVFTPEGWGLATKPGAELQLAKTKRFGSTH